MKYFICGLGALVVVVWFSALFLLLSGRTLYDSGDDANPTQQVELVSGSVGEFGFGAEATLSNSNDKLDMSGSIATTKLAIMTRLAAKKLRNHEITKDRAVSIRNKATYAKASINKAVKRKDLAQLERFISVIESDIDYINLERKK